MADEFRTTFDQVSAPPEQPEQPCVSKPNLYIFDDLEVERHRLLLQAQILRTYMEDHARDYVPTIPTRILDLGCGVGDLTEALHHFYPQAEMVGIDRNPEAIATARARAGLQTATFVVGDIQEGLPPGPFDLVYTSVVLYHVPDLARVVALVHDVLAPGGVFWIREPHPRLPEQATQPDHQYIAAHFARGAQQMGGHPYVGDELPPLLTAAGFTDIRVIDEETYPLGGDTIEGETMLANWIAGTRAAAKMLSRLTGSPAEEIVRHTDALLAAARASAEPVGFSPLINIVARR